MSWNWIDCVKRLQDEGRVFVVATITAVKGSSPREVGAKLVVLPDGRFYGTVGGGLLEQSVKEDAAHILKEMTTSQNLYPLCFRTGQCCGGSVEVFYEVIGLKPTLFIFGAGHVGQAVCQVMSGTPFRIVLIDSREEWIFHSQVRGLAELIHRNPIDFIRNFVWTTGDNYIAIMTHDHALDEDIVAIFAEKPYRYIGLIGSDTKWQRMRRRLTERGINQNYIDSIECPLGMAIGGKTPKEVAVSLAARLIKIFHDQSKS